MIVIPMIVSLQVLNLGYYKTWMYGKHLALHTPHGGNTSLGAGVSQTYCCWRVTLVCPVSVPLYL